MTPAEEAKDKPQISRISQMTRMKKEGGSVLGLCHICVLCEICAICGFGSYSLVVAEDRLDLPPQWEVA